MRSLIHIFFNNPIRTSLILLIILTDITCIYSQTDPGWFKEYRTVVPGKRYSANGFHRFFFGDNWRDVWTTPVKIGVIDMDKYAGGLKPLRKGGGNQSKSIRFMGNDGIEYKFHSLDKDVSKALPPELQNSIAEDVIQDGISTANPYACLTIPPMLDSLGIYHSDYTLVIIPDDPALGEFRSEFAGQIGTMEIVPDEKLYPGSDKVTGSDKMFDNIYESYNEFVDGKEFLKARLLDIFINDGSRHKDQWKWIRFPKGDDKIYEPFPMDRDQPYLKLEGLLTKLGAKAIPNMQNFTEDYPDMLNITWQARELDQRLLAFLSKSEWDDAANFVYSKLTDELIETSIKRLPEEVYAKAAPEIISKLKARRTKFKSMSDEFYNYVNSVVDIHTTDLDDLIKVELNASDGIKSASLSDNGYTVISVYKPAGKDGEPEKLLKQRYFDNKITEEIRIHAEKGKDKIEIKGRDGSGPKIRVIGGKGKDEIVNSSSEKILFYDEGDKSKIKGEVSWDDSEFDKEKEAKLKRYKTMVKKLSGNEKEMYEDSIGYLKYDPVVPLDKFSSFGMRPKFDYNPDFGVMLGLRFDYKKYGFRMDPDLYDIALTTGYVSQKVGLSALLLEISSNFYGIVHNSIVNLTLRMTGSELNNYFGQGNNTVYNEEIYNNKYNRVGSEIYSVNPSISFPRNKSYRISLGSILKFIESDRERSPSVSDLNPYGAYKFTLLSLNAGFELDKTDHPEAPYTGYYFNASAGYYPAIFNNRSQFAKLSGEIRGHLGYKTRISLALRLRGEKNFGTYPYFESAFLGGSKSLRGYPRERFAGDASLLASSELRLNLFTLHFPVKEDIGIFGFIETGRVYLKDEDSKIWHSAYGGGIFMSFLNRDNTFKFTIAKSKEQKLRFYLNTGFVF